jgi:hypothetical protein
MRELRLFSLACLCDCVEAGLAGMLESEAVGAIDALYAVCGAAEREAEDMAVAAAEARQSARWEV